MVRPRTPSRRARKRGHRWTPRSPRWLSGNILAPARYTGRYLYTGNKQYRADIAFPGLAHRLLHSRPGSSSGHFWQPGRHVSEFNLLRRRLDSRSTSDDSAAGRLCHIRVITLPAATVCNRVSDTFCKEVRQRRAKVVGWLHSETKCRPRRWQTRATQLVQTERRDSERHERVEAGAPKGDLAGRQMPI